jgi:hypothetical protein
MVQHTVYGVAHRHRIDAKTGGTSEAGAARAPEWHEDIAENATNLRSINVAQIPY